MFEEHCDCEPPPDSENKNSAGPIIDYLLSIYSPLREKDSDRTFLEFMLCGWLIILMVLTGLISVIFVLTVVFPTFPLWFPIYKLGEWSRNKWDNRKLEDYYDGEKEL